ncbi:hypothetical protein M758_12G155000 [Ceratodon purpureus]|uniref:Secreted protein n=1 Tax=Ceratodon purpureus TaxID=3225 RepID=A0A8T0G8X4_CERPU|nr:hypothetical protein KC19_12G152800 [Ceratodon purpureus]KAG0599481.1 hypothetical protein M758_12G155000 [Ceratodon purpureus]
MCFLRTLVLMALRSCSSCMFTTLVMNNLNMYITANFQAPEKEKSDSRNPYSCGEPGQGQTHVAYTLTHVASVTDEHYQFRLSSQLHPFFLFCS